MAELNQPEIKQLDNNLYQANFQYTGEMKKTIEKVIYDHIRSKVKVKGFRPGKAPDHIIKLQYKDKVEEYLLNILYVELTDYLRKNLLPEVFQVQNYENLEITDSEIHGTLFYYADPYAELPKIKKHKYMRYRPNITSKDIEEEIDNRLRKIAEFKESEESASKGDIIVIDYEIWENDVPVGDPVKDTPIVLGENRFLKQIEDEIIQKSPKKGEEITVEVKSTPQQEGEVETKRDFVITIKSVEKPEIPELTNEVVEKITYGNVKNTEELSDYIRNYLTKFFDLINYLGEWTRFFEYLYENAEFHFPPQYTQLRWKELIEKFNVKEDEIPEAEKKGIMDELEENAKKEAINQAISKMIRDPFDPEEQKKIFEETLDLVYESEEGKQALKSTLNELGKDTKMPEYVENFFRYLNAYYLYKYAEHNKLVKKGSKMTLEQLKKLYSF